MKAYKRKSLTPDQIYNANETGLFWHCLSKNTFTPEESQSSGIKEDKQIILLTSANVAGSRKCKLFVVGEMHIPVH